MNHPVHRSLKAAYSFYNVHTTTPLLDLMSDALILAKSVRSLLIHASVFSLMLTFRELMSLFLLIFYTERV